MVVNRIKFQQFEPLQSTHLFIFTVLSVLILFYLSILPAWALGSKTLSACEQFAGSTYQDDISSAGVPFNKIDSEKAIKACSTAIKEQPNSAKYQYMLGRALDAGKYFHKAAAYYQKAAEQGYSLAINNLGALYLSGNGVEKNKKTGISWVRKAAEKGLAIAQNTLAKAYSNGDGIEQNDVEAAKWFLNAAKGGYLYAKYRTGLQYEKGIGVSKDLTEAIHWYQQAAEQNHEISQYRIGLLYKNRLNPDYKKAVFWLKQAARNKRYTEAIKALADLYEKGMGVKKDKKEAERLRAFAKQYRTVRFTVSTACKSQSGETISKSLYIRNPEVDENPAIKAAINVEKNTGCRVEENVVESFGKIAKIARDNNVEFLDLALYSFSGKGSQSKEKDKKVSCVTTAKAIFLKSTKATAKNAISICESELDSNPTDPDLQYYYATTLFELKRVSKSDMAPNAEKWFKKAANNGSRQAAAMLGMMYRKGWKVEKDPIEAAKWLKVAANAGYTAAYRDLGEMYFSGSGVKQNFAKALDSFKKAAKQGDSSAQSWLGGIYNAGAGVKRDYVEARYWFQKAAKQGDNDAQYWLGILFFNGEGGVTEYKKAYKWFTLAAEKNHPAALYRLGLMYLLGKGVKQDNQKAISFYEKAAKLNYDEAQFQLGVLFHKGYIVKQDYKKAVYWLTQAANQDDNRAQVRLAYRYKSGEGVVKDEKKARYWFERSADLGNTHAMVVASQINILAGNYDKAQNWLEIAANKKDENAIELLKDLNELKRIQKKRKQ